MLAIARALMSRPRLLLCDEPSLGLAPLITQELFAVLKSLNQQDGLSVLLVEQNANLALKVASKVYLLETGQVVASGNAEAIAGDERIRKAYLGG
jgi:branched-chain amino acid transport system ATP-binding protein